MIHGNDSKSGILTRILELHTKNYVSAERRRGENFVIQNRQCVVTEMEITRDDEHTAVISFYGLILPSSIGSHIIYWAEFALYEQIPDIHEKTFFRQRLEDITLGLTYEGNMEDFGKPEDYVQACNRMRERDSLNRM